MLGATRTLPKSSLERPKTYENHPGATKMQQEAPHAPKKRPRVKNGANIVVQGPNTLWVGGMLGPPLKHVKTAFPAVYKTYCFDTPGHRERCGGFFMLRACHRPRDRESFRGNSSKNIDFAYFSDVSALLGSRELRAVKIPASYDAWRPPNVDKTIWEKFDLFGLGNQFFVIFLHFKLAKRF